MVDIIPSSDVDILLSDDSKLPRKDKPSNMESRFWDIPANAVVSEQAQDIGLPALVATQHTVEKRGRHEKPYFVADGNVDMANERDEYTELAQVKIDRMMFYVQPWSPECGRGEYSRSLPEIVRSGEYVLFCLMGPEDDAEFLEIQKAWHGQTAKLCKVEIDGNGWPELWFSRKPETRALRILDATTGEVLAGDYRKLHHPYGYQVIIGAEEIK